MATHEHHAGHGGADHPAVGAILMSLSTIVVALNAQLLRRVDLRPTRHRSTGRTVRGSAASVSHPG
jgi:hypothetical protein